MAALSWDQRHAVAGGSAATVVLLCGLPVLWLVLDIDPARLLPLDNWANALFLRSVLLATAAAALALVFGAVAAIALSWLPRGVQRALLLVLALPLFLPSYVHALAWSDLLSQISRLVTASELSALDGSNWLIATWVLALSYSPVALLSLHAALQHWDKRYEWSAWTHGRAPLAVAALKARYLIAPTVMAALVMFLLAFSDFAIADYFQVRTFSTEVFVQVSSYLDVSAAVGLSLPAVILTVVAIAVLVRSAARSPLTAGSHTSAGRQRDAPGRLRLLLGGLLSVLFLLLALLPVLALAAQIETVDRFLAALRMIWTDALTGAAIAAACALLAVLLSLFATYGCDRRLPPCGGWLQIPPATTFAVPASLLGLASIGLWNRAYTAGWLYDSGLALVMAVGARWLFVPFVVLALGWRQTSRVQEAAGLASGRAWLPVLATVLLRPMAPAIGAAFFLVFIFAFNELTFVTLLAPPGLSTLPLRVFQTVHYGPQSLLAAICIWQVLFLIVPLAALWSCVRGMRRVSEGR